jgi:hypothetical protein
LILNPEADVELLEPDPSSSNTPLARPAIERDEDEPFVRLTDSLGGDLERALLLNVGESISPSSTSPASRMLSERMGILAGRCSPFPRPIGQRLTLGATRIERASPKKSESRFQHPFSSFSFPAFSRNSAAVAGGVTICTQTLQRAPFPVSSVRALRIARKKSSRFGGKV